MLLARSCRLARASRLPVAALAQAPLSLASWRWMSVDIREALQKRGMNPKEIIHNATAPVLSEHAVKYDPGSQIMDTGALCVTSGKKTGRSPNDKRLVEEPSSSELVDWGTVNMKMQPAEFKQNHNLATSYLNTRERVYVVDGFAGWDERYRKKVRVICERPYHALFMRVMLIRPSVEELENFGEPDLTIVNAGKFTAYPYMKGMTSTTSINLDLGAKEMVILGSEYAGEMKKGVFTYMMYSSMVEGGLPLHASMNQAADGTTTLFFGLSGTGKTTLSADINRNLIGDDEHVWTDTGCFNIEGGCYAKCVDLSAEQEPEIYHAIKFGALLENVVLNDRRQPMYSDVSITQNTRCAYPLEHIPNSVIPAIGDHPTNVIFLTCDAFGVLPPVSRLSPEQASYHFLSGYTAKVAGTEQGVKEPVATFSACYGGPFLVLHPTSYADRLAEKLRTHKCNAWLVNTGWTGGGFGVGSRMSIKHTRELIDKIHDGSLVNAQYDTLPQFGLSFVSQVEGVPEEVLDPRKSWADKDAYNTALTKLAKLFSTNFQKNYGERVSNEVHAAGPH